MKAKEHHIEIEIDKLTRSIENLITGDSFPTEVTILENADLQLIIKKHGWRFDWNAEFRLPDRDVYKLTIRDNLSVIQGLISLTEKADHVYMHLIESAPFNIGKQKVYLGVPGNLIAFACRLSFHRGYEGYISFTSKSNLIEHYISTLGAKLVGNQLMIIDTIAASKLINKYFKE